MAGGGRCKQHHTARRVPGAAGARAAIRWENGAEALAELQPCSRVRRQRPRSARTLRHSWAGWAWSSSAMDTRPTLLSRTWCQTVPRSAAASSTPVTNCAASTILISRGAKGPRARSSRSFLARTARQSRLPLTEARMKGIRSDSPSVCSGTAASTPTVCPALRLGQRRRPTRARRASKAGRWTRATQELTDQRPQPQFHQWCRARTRITPHGQQRPLCPQT